MNSTKYRKDGTRIKTLYYACGGWVMKGASCCEKFFLRKAPLEAVLLDAVRGRLASLVGGGGEALLRGYIEEELGAQGKHPGREVAQVRARLAEIEQKANVLLEGMSAETRDFVDAKLRDLAQERQRLQDRLDALGSAPRAAIDPDVVLRDGLAAIRDMSRLMDAASLEERKELIHAFVSGVTVHPDEARLDVMVAQMPVLAANSSVGVVAGARYERVQMNLHPLDRFLAGLKRAA